MDETPLTKKEIEDGIKTIQGWVVEKDVITKKIPVDDFMSGADLIVQIARVAEKINHHPDITLSFGSISISTTTHSAGGITEKDFSLAREVDRLLP